MDRASRIKLAVAGAALALAGLMTAQQLGVFRRPPPPVEPAPTEQDAGTPTPATTGPAPASAARPGAKQNWNTSSGGLQPR
ncbi:MAG: hypothetical protein AB7K52_08250 [Phycisphaerales bacterium]